MAATEAVELLGAHPEACVVNVLGLGGRDTVETIAATLAGGRCGLRGKS